MPDPKRNAAIYYLEDGFNPQKGLNGRRMAGQSFLKGFLTTPMLTNSSPYPIPKSGSKLLYRSQKNMAYPSGSKAF